MNKRATRRAGATLAATAILAATFGVAPAFAADDDALSTPTSVVDVVQALTPDVAQTTSTDVQTPTTVVSDGAAADVSVNIASGGSVITSDATATASGQVASVSITPIVAASAGSASDGMTVRVNDDDHFAALTQPLDNGVRNLTVITSADAPNDYGYRVTSNAGTLSANKFDDGSLVLSSASGQTVTAVAAPWAEDAAGRSVATSYTWVEGVLTQHLDLSDPSITFPVVADPQWGYDFDLIAMPGPGYSDGGLTATVKAVDSELRTCFNCSFPISGAPSTYPQIGNIFPLNASPFTFINVNAAVRVNTTGFGTFGFYAQPGHFDGQGSMVFFRFFNDSRGYLHLNVNATILKDRGAIANAGNREVARQRWTTFVMTASCKAAKYKMGRKMNFC